MPNRMDLSDLEGLKSLYQELLDRPLPTLASVNRWMEDVKEVTAALGENDALIYIRKSVNTRDEEAQAAYLRLIQKIHPRFRPIATN